MTARRLIAPIAAARGCAALIMVTALAACAQPTAQPGNEIAAVSEGWENALNAGDIDTITGMYTEDCRLLPPGAALAEGREVVRAAFGEMIAAGLKGDLETVQAVQAGDVGYRVGTFSLRSGDGEAVDHGKFIETWRKVDGTWKITNDIWNSDLPISATGTLVSITHEVEDRDRWLAAWRGPAGRPEMFKQHGVAGVRVFASADDPKRVGLVVAVEDLGAFEAFLQSEEGQRAKAEDGVVADSVRMMMPAD